MAVPYLFATRSGNVPASELDADFQYVLDNTVQTNAVNEFTARQFMTGAPYDWDKGSNIASASSINLQTMTGNYATISGTNTVTSCTLNEGAWRMVRATGAFTWQNNASVVVQGGANYTATVGDFFLVIGDSGGVVYVLKYPVSGSPLVNIASGGTGQTTSVTAFDALDAQGADIASAATVNLAAATGPFVNVTGSGGPITALGTATAGVQRTVKFASTPTITHNGTSLILPGAANITAATNDTAHFISLGSGNWVCAWYKKQSGVAIAGLGAQLASAVAITGGAIDATVLGGSTPAAGTFTTATDAVGRLQAAPGFTTANLTDITNAANTTNKFTGKLVRDTTLKEFLVAAGATAGAVWTNYSGGSDITPV